MPRILKRRPSAAMTVAMLALFVALGGASYAATSLPANSVGVLPALGPNAVTTGKIAPNAVTSAKVLNRSLLCRRLQGGPASEGERKGRPAPRSSGRRGCGRRGRAARDQRAHARDVHLLDRHRQQERYRHLPEREEGDRRRLERRRRAPGQQREPITQAAVTSDNTGFRVDGKLSDNNDMLVADGARRLRDRRRLGDSVPPAPSSHSTA